MPKKYWVLHEIQYFNLTNPRNIQKKTCQVQYSLAVHIHKFSPSLIHMNLPRDSFCTDFFRVNISHYFSTLTCTSKYYSQPQPAYSWCANAFPWGSNRGFSPFCSNEICSTGAFVVVQDKLCQLHRLQQYCHKKSRQSNIIIPVKMSGDFFIKKHLNKGS